MLQLGHINICIPRFWTSEFLTEVEELFVSSMFVPSRAFLIVIFIGVGRVRFLRILRSAQNPPEAPTNTTGRDLDNDSMDCVFEKNGKDANIGR